MGIVVLFTTIFLSCGILLEQGVHNQVYIAMIVYCLHVLAQLNTNSSKTYLKISRLLKAAPWKSAHLWIRKITGKAVP